MTDHPALFNAPMVRGLLREIEQPGTGKTMTRRVLRMQPPEWATCCEQPSMYNALHQWVPSGFWRWSEELQDPPRALRSWPVDDEGQHYWLRPPIAKGDRLWVREAWRCNGWASDLATIFYRASEGDSYTAMCEQYPVAGRQPLRVTGSWRPSIHMPRWASRLTLYVADVRVQRLREINEEDAKAEGAKPWTGALQSYATDFARIWRDINGPDAWDANPWVMAVTFVPRRGNIDCLPAELTQEAEHGK